MKIVFAGCSFTAGGELENPEEERFSRLVCNRLNVEEYNVSRNGYSNDLLFHKFLKFSTTCGKPDIAVIQWTNVIRWQIWDDTLNDWESIAIKMVARYKNNEIKPMPRTTRQWSAFRYYRHVYSDQHGIENYWKNVYLAEQYCKDNNIKLIMMEMKSKELTVDYVSPYQSLCESKIPSIKRGIIPVPKHKTPEWYEYYMEMMHPSPKGHQLIADYVEEQIQLLSGGNS